MESAYAGLILPHLQLCTLTAIDHEQLLVHVDQLRGRVVQCGRHGRSATQYGYLEFSHVSVCQSAYEFEDSMPIEDYL